MIQQNLSLLLQRVDNFLHFLVDVRDGRDVWAGLLDEKKSKCILSSRQRIYVHHIWCTSYLTSLKTPTINE